LPILTAPFGREGIVAPSHDRCATGRWHADPTPRRGTLLVGDDQTGYIAVPFELALAAALEARCLATNRVPAHWLRRFRMSRDPHDLIRFIHAQETDYETALSEVRAGRKRSHWMWYIFPQFTGLGSSEMSRRYAIQRRAEAEEYLKHPALGPRLVEICEAVLGVDWTVRARHLRLAG
jgi:hypothetical protein